MRKFLASLLVGIAFYSSPAQVNKFKELLYGKFDCLNQRNAVPGKNREICRLSCFAMPVSDGRLLVNDEVLIQDARYIFHMPEAAEPVYMINSGLSAQEYTPDAPPQNKIRCAVADSINGLPVPSAPIVLNFNSPHRKSKSIFADSTGHFALDKQLLRSLSSITISSVGYQKKIMNRAEIPRSAGRLVLARRIVVHDMVYVVLYPQRFKIQYNGR